MSDKRGDFVLLYTILNQTLVTPQTTAAIFIHLLNTFAEEIQQIKRKAALVWKLHRDPLQSVFNLSQLNKQLTISETHIDGDACKASTHLTDKPEQAEAKEACVLGLNTNIAICRVCARAP